MNARAVIIIAMIVMFMVGAMDGVFQSLAIPMPPILNLGTSVLCAFMAFLWYWADSNSRGWPRSPWLNIAVILLMLLAIPYYLVRSRPHGQRLSAVLKCLGCFVVMVVCMMAGLVSAVAITPLLA